MERRVGAHLVQIEGDLLILTQHGDFTLDDMKTFTAIADTHGGPFGYLLTLVDLTDAGSLPADARRYSADRVREAQRRGPIYAATALYGAGLVTRGMATLYFSAIRLLSAGGQTTYFAKTSEEARAHLAERRQYFRSQLKPAQ